MISLDTMIIRKNWQKVTYQSNLIIRRASNLSPSLPSVVSQQQVVHIVSMKDRKHNAPQNNSTMTTAMLITPKSSSINHTRITIYHYDHANQ